MKSNAAFKLRVTDYLARSPYNFSSIRELKKFFEERNKEGIKSQLSYMVTFSNVNLTPITGLFNAPYKEEEADKLDRSISDLLTDSKTIEQSNAEEPKAKTFSR